MKNLRFGILGAAKVFEKRMGPAIKRSTVAEVTHIATRDSERAKIMGQEYSCRTSKSYMDVVTDDSVDAVYIPLPNSLHEKWCILALEHGKHVICEKSLTLSYESADRIAACARANEKLIIENFMCGHHSQHKKIRELIQSEEIGIAQAFVSHFGIPHLKEDDIRYNRELGGGALNDLGAYGVFMARKILSERILGGELTSFSDKFDVDTRGTINLRLSGGKMAAIVFGFGLDYTNRYEIWGEKGKIQVDFAFSIPEDMIPKVQIIKNGISSVLDLKSDDQFLRTIEAFARDVRNTKLFEGHYEELLEQARIMDILRKSTSVNKSFSENSKNFRKKDT